MVESYCPSCSRPVLSGQAYCAGCGASLRGSAAPAVDAAPGTPTEMDPAGAGRPRFEDPSIQIEVEPAPDPAERLPGSYVPPSPGLEPATRAMRPSSASSASQATGPSMSLRVGARPISLAGGPAAAETRATGESDPQPAAPRAPDLTAAVPPPAAPPAAEIARAIQFAPSPPPQGAVPPPPPPPPYRPHVAPPPAYVVPVPPTRSPFAAPAVPVAPPAPQQPAAVDAPARPARKESTQELVAFGLVAAGAVIGIVSLFLPWSGVTGIGIGTLSVAGSPPPPNQWGWGMPAGFPLFLLSLPVLIAAAGSDRAQEQWPNLAQAMGRLTDLILPMVLGGLYLGVAFMYMTVPNSYGAGLYAGQYALVLGACLSIAGAIVTIFSPPEAAQDVA